MSLIQGSSNSIDLDEGEETRMKMSIVTIDDELNVKPFLTQSNSLLTNGNVNLKPPQHQSLFQKNVKNEANNLVPKLDLNALNKSKSPSKPLGDKYADL